MNSPVMYTPEQVATILQVSKNTVYNLIARGEINAKKFGKVFRIPKTALSFVFTGLDADLLAAQSQDEENIAKVSKTLRQARKSVWRKNKSS